MKIAVQGCCHGALDEIYDVLQQVVEKDGEKVDLLLCCGDFQAVRNSEDLSCMAVPNKYKKMGSFYKYYSGEKSAPVLTIFIGGNHEAINHLRELGFGGWVAPNIYYLGHSGVIRYGGLRIGGISGIYKGYDYNKGHYERPPYNSGSLRTAYHIRSSDVYKLKLLTGDIDIMMSHDWPLGIHNYGNHQQLFRIKPYFREEAEQNTLGSPPAMELLQHLCPSYWFSAHLHCKFSAIYRHKQRLTKFLALDKCLPRGGYLQIIDIPSWSPPYSLEYDLEWLSILKATDSVMPYSSRVWFPPDPSSLMSSIQLAHEDICEKFDNEFTVPYNFKVTSPPHQDGESVNLNAVAQDRENIQTLQFCEKLGIKSPWSAVDETPVKNPAEISLDSSDDETERTFELDFSTEDTFRDPELTEDELKLVSSELNPNKEVEIQPPGFIDNQALTLSSSDEVHNPDEICISDDD